MSQKVNSGQVVVSDTEVTVSEVASNGIVLAPTVSVEKDTFRWRGCCRYN